MCYLLHILLCYWGRGLYITEGGVVLLKMVLCYWGGRCVIVYVTVCYRRGAVLLGRVLYVTEDQEGAVLSGRALYMILKMVL